MLEFVVSELKSAAEHFYRLSGIKTVLYDEARNFLFSYPDHMCDFCRIVRGSFALQEKCFACDRVGFELCEQSRAPYLYRCHMGLTEAVMPIYENDLLIGYMMMGQILCDEAHADVMRAIGKASASHKLDEQALTQALASLKSVSPEFIQSALSMMAMCVCYLYSNRIIQRHSTELTEQLKSYIRHHLAEPLSIPSLCKRFYLSKTKLYQAAQKAFGMGISEYVCHCRLEESKRLLQTTDKRISEIATAVGFEDSNYFIRIFRQKNGQTPGQYRALCRNDKINQ